MNKFYFFIYNVVVLPVVSILFKIYGLLNSKVQKGIKGRERLIEKLIIELKGIDNSKKLIWFHSSSMGEFEQAKPIIENLKALGIYNILVTFFSPSGYENQKNYPYADIVSYAPFDNPKDVKRFLSYISPSILIFMRYDLWPNLVYHVSKRKIPIFLVDATFSKSQGMKLPFVKSFYKSLYSRLSAIITVTDDDRDGFISLGVNPSKIKVAGDTRFDRVNQKSIEAKDKNLIDKSIFGNSKLFVFGSSWEADEENIFPAVSKLLYHKFDITMIVAPHEPTLTHIEGIEKYFSPLYKTIRFSEMRNYDGEKIIIVDSVGILLSLYFYADFAYVGGSVKQGIHNVLEPAVYGIPVLFGRKHHNSIEAEQLVKLGSGLVVYDKKSAYKTIRKLVVDDDYRTNLGEISRKFVHSKIGSTSTIVKELHKYI
jgi:3-deoxy-D-manno-octulosonic-acid transferase